MPACGAILTIGWTGRGQRRIRVRSLSVSPPSIISAVAQHTVPRAHSTALPPPINHAYPDSTPSASHQGKDHNNNFRPNRIPTPFVKLHSTDPRTHCHSHEISPGIPWVGLERLSPPLRPSTTRLQLVLKNPTFSPRSSNPSRKNPHPWHPS
ncbi:hypothetical protein PGTUg99_032788 [Puccinia graminis f. sp. tritici]|uniref:Uncharacterized protein n=1 Tax=Puccinia graminis f. sp. tritici TaxID=56615 RepID=A0A5B0N5K7_PUCGR|nr:hypothetical protein PGTUg99_032788 [Puccinia graminis f. sp. tritici]